MCGGTTWPSPRLKPSMGLSPRVRGNPIYLNGRVGYHRSIPACAGEPAPATAPSPPAKVYPRVCGGTVLMLPSQVGKSGLSPRVRGNLLVAIRADLWTGSIPACAGEP